VFRFKLTPAANQPTHASDAALKALLRVGIVLCCLLIVVGWFAWHGNRRAEEPDTGPILLSMQKIGQLHTAQMNWKEVLHQDSDQQPDGWLGSFPGVNEIAHWATHNRTLVTAEGSVEAGVDLSRLTEKDITRVTQPDGSIRLRVHLPAVTIYSPNVHVTVERTDPGPFWRDENIVPKAEAEARRRFQEAAEKENIRARAQENAIQTLQQMQRALGFHNIEFSF